MFTGIIEEVGRVERAIDAGGGKKLTVRASFAHELQVNQSVAVNGACLTVVGHSADRFDVVAVEETLVKTALGRLSSGDRVNLERAMKPGDRLDGHFVQGHVDAIGEIDGIEVRESSRLFRVRFERRFSAYVIPTGSIALDGISLTTASVGENDAVVSIIPYTLEHTNVGGWKQGTAVNIEFDLIGKYVVRRLDQDNQRPSGGLTEGTLREKGF